MYSRDFCNALAFFKEKKHENPTELVKVLIRKIWWLYFRVSTQLLSWQEPPLKQELLWKPFV